MSGCKRGLGKGSSSSRYSFRFLNLSSTKSRSNLMSNRKGMEDKMMFVMWELIVIAMIVIILMVAVRNISNNTTYWKKYHSADLALISDLAMTNSGDFTINYNMKELRKNFATKVLRIDSLSFYVALKDNAFFVYDKSPDDDRFPQSYIFAGNGGVVSVKNSNLTSDYVIISKDGSNLVMKDYYTTSTIGCPSIDTAVSESEFNSKLISTVSLSDNDNITAFSKKTNILFDKSEATTKDLTIFIVNSSSVSLFYNSASNDAGKSNKMACLIYKYLLSKNPDLNIRYESYSNFLDSDSRFSSQISSSNDGQTNSNYWLILGLKGDRSLDGSVRDALDDAVAEYYGVNR